MKWLVDANVLSEATRPVPAPNVVRWLQQHELDLSIDAIILGEIRFGILQLPKSRRRDQLEEWFGHVIKRIHCLHFTDETGLSWAELLVKLRKAGRAMPIKDSLIAATALAHGLTVVTRNTKDFQNAGVRTFNPFNHME